MLGKDPETGLTSVIDIPDEYISTENYVASLAHKCNHNFDPNASYELGFRCGSCHLDRNVDYQKFFVVVLFLMFISFTSYEQPILRNTKINVTNLRCSKVILNF